MNPFTFQGRLGRFHYFGYSVIFAIAFVVIGAIVGGALSGPNPNDPSSALGGASLLLTIGFFVATTSLGVRRLHDFEKSGWWYLFAFIPFVNIVFALILIFAPGTPGENRYGSR